MIDQYGNAVPADLTVLPPFEHLDDAERAIVFHSDWWEANGVLLWFDEAGIGGDDPRDAGLQVDEDGNLIGCEVLRVDDCLHRGSDKEGWYHA